jgi:sec-independent protein translocase protein TatC
MNSVEKELPFWEHVEDLRKTIFAILLLITAGFFVSFIYYETIFAFLTHPLAAAGPDATSEKLVFFSPVDGIMMTLKVCIWSGAVLTSPFWLYILFRFISPGLNSNEQKLILPFLLLSTSLFSAGIGFALSITIPFANAFLYQFNAGIGTNLWSYTQYLDYTLMLTLSTGIAFEIFAILFFIVHLKGLRAETLASYRKGVIVGCLIIGAIFTPPDVITQCLLAFPMIALYEGVIIYARLLARKNSS